MSRLLIDTSVWIDFFSKKYASVRINQALKDGLVFTTPIIIAEILSGRLTAKQRKQLSGIFEVLPMQNFSVEHAQDVGQYRARLQQKGLSVSLPDAHIALASKNCSAALFSKDKVFIKVRNIDPDLRLM